MHNFKQIVTIATVIVFSFTLQACESQKKVLDEPIVMSKDELLGTIITLSIYENVGEGVFNQCFNIISDIDKRMSVNVADSEISMLNKNSGIGSISISKDTYSLIEQSKTFSQLSNGAFDISVGAVMELWKIDSSFSRRPSDSEITNNLSLVNYDNIILEDNNKVFLKERGMMIDLGAIAKGYACDKVADVLREHDVRHAILDLGGNIHAYGTKPNGEGWKIGIKSPFVGDADIAAYIEVSDKAIVTSGGYERFFEENGTQYNHILDPKTGFPVENNLAGVTIISKSSTRADGLSTTCYVLGIDKGMALLDSLDDCEGIFITKDKNIYVTEGFRNKVFIVDETYILK